MLDLANSPFKKMVIQEEDDLIVIGTDICYTVHIL